MSISAVYMGEGYGISITSNGKSGQRTYYSAEALPHKTPVTLPDLGSAWDLTTNTDLICTGITATGIAESPGIGLKYILNYSSSIYTTDPLGRDEDLRKITITSSAETDGYEVDGAKTTIYTTSNGTDFEQLTDTIPVVKTGCLFNISVTKRITGNVFTWLAEQTSTVNCVNSSSFLGFPKGCVKYVGGTVDSVKSIDSYPVSVEYDVSYNYVAKMLPGIATDAWQTAFYNGEYVRLSTTNASGGYILLYPEASFTSPL